MKKYRVILPVVVIAFSVVILTWLILNNRLAQENHWQLTNVEGHLPDLRFSLTADRGESVTEKDFYGYVTLLYFGFTSCPDQCPTTMLKLANVTKQLGVDGDFVRILFVTVDQRVDTPQILHAYLKNFDPDHMTGLTGSESAIEDLAKRYRAAYSPRDKSGDADSVLHGDAIYIFDNHGHARLLASSSDADASFVHDLHILAQARVNP